MTTVSFRVNVALTRDQYAALFAEYRREHGTGSKTTYTDYLDSLAAELIGGAALLAAAESRTAREAAR